MHRYDRVATAYGTLLDSIEVAGEDGPIQLEVLNPFAVVSYLLATNLAAAVFFRVHLAGKTTRLVFYHDSVTPGL